MYSAVIADPPWKYGSPNAMVGNGGRGKGGENVKQVSLENHYDTMTVEEICDLKPEVNKNSMIGLWITNPMLAEGAHVPILKSWGFSPVTVVTWAKVKSDGITPSRKTGHWFRSASEHFVLGTRGAIRRPEPWPAFATWFSGGRLPHSVKPDFLHEFFERLFPEEPKLEMFARRLRSGWDAWGNQAPSRYAADIEELL